MRRVMDKTAWDRALKAERIAVREKIIQSLVDDIQTCFYTRETILEHAVRISGLTLNRLYLPIDLFSPDVSVGFDGETVTVEYGEEHPFIFYSDKLQQLDTGNDIYRGSSVKITGRYNGEEVIIKGKLEKKDGRND